MPEWDIIPPPATMTVQHEHKAVLYLPDGRALVRQAGFRPGGRRCAVADAGSATPNSECGAAVSEVTPTTTSVSSATEPNATVTGSLTLRDLLDRMEAAYHRTGATNPHRDLWLLAAQVIVQQGQQIAGLERAARAADTRIILPGND